MRNARANIGAATIAAMLALIVTAPRAWAWDNATHKLITRLAIGALPPSPLKDAFQAHASQLAEYSVEPDTVLKERYGEAERRRHYIDLEYYGRDPFAALTRDRAAMDRRFGRARVNKAGTLPWTIDEMASKSADAWRRGDCAAMFLYSGYLSHYAGDATQPLHTTIHFDGYRRDRGVHARVELAVEHETERLGRAAAPQVHAATIESPWDTALGELRGAHALVNETIRLDRDARRSGGLGSREYEQALMARGESMFARQIAQGASALASIWLLEWRQAGSPALCNRAPGAVSGEYPRDFWSYRPLEYGAAGQINLN